MNESHLEPNDDRASLSSSRIPGITARDSHKSVIRGLPVPFWWSCLWYSNFNFQIVKGPPKKESRIREGGRKKKRSSHVGRMKVGPPPLPSFGSQGVDDGQRPDGGYIRR